MWFRYLVKIMYIYTNTVFSDGIKVYRPHMTDYSPKILFTGTFIRRESIRFLIIFLK